jgi:hypothetical protein
MRLTNEQAEGLHAMIMREVKSARAVLWDFEAYKSSTVSLAARVIASHGWYYHTNLGYSS